MTMIKCAYCDSSNVEYSDDVNERIELYYCDNCNEYFYVREIIDIVEIQVSKDKYKNYKTTYNR